MEKESDISEMFAFIKSGKMNLWELDNLFGNAEDAKILRQIFPSQELFELIKALVRQSVAALEQHNNSNETHENIRALLNNLEAKFRNHRHETGKTYSAKPEY